MYERLRKKGVAWCVKKGTPYISLLPVALLLRIILLIIKPLVHIRFGQLLSSRIGILSLGTEFYLCEKDAGMHPGRYLDLWYHHDGDAPVLADRGNRRDFICNKQLAAMWERVLHVNQVAGFLDKLNRMVPRGGDAFIVEPPPHFDIHGLLSRFPPHLTFTPEEQDQGLSGLLEMGIEPGAKFICFHARDSEYLNRTRPRNEEIHGDWSWQNYRDASVHNYLLAAERFTELGYYAIRMGKYVNQPLVCQNPRVIDYATRFQSDFMDLFLSAKASLFLGQDSGMAALPMCFRTPMVFVNVGRLTGLGLARYEKGICIPKKYYSGKLGRCLTFQEIFDFGLHHYTPKYSNEHAVFLDLGVEIIENTPEEIWEASKEMHQRLDSTFSPTEEDIELQTRFSSIVSSNVAFLPAREDSPPIIMGAHFLRNNRGMLD